MEPSQNVPPSYKPDVDTIAEMFSVDHSTAFMCLKNANYNKEVFILIFRELFRSS